MSKPIRALFVASELTPIAKVGGLGDVIGTLPKALSDLGVDVKIVIPKYGEIDNRNLKLVISGWPTGFENERINVYKTKFPKSSVEVFLIENKKYLSRGPIYFEHTAFAGRFEEIQRFIFFSKAVFGLLNAEIFSSDIIHCHDWHTGALVTSIKRQTSSIKPKTIFTIHNLGNQGKWNFDKVTRWFGKNNFQKFGNNFNFIAEGVLNADLITTVSPSYAKEILTKEYGLGLENLLRKRRKDLVGILNGIDYGFWPVSAKASADKPYTHPHFGFVARLTYQKGLSLLLPIIPEFIEKYGAEFHFLGQGEARFEKWLEKLSKKYPKKVFVKIGFDEKLAHRIYAQSDFFLIPSAFEPSGLGQMISMHYGNIPIVRETGGLKDSVKHLKTGFVFKEKTSEALAKVMELAVDYFYNKPKQLKSMQKNCRKQDFSWGHSANKYKALYKNLLIS